MTGGAGDDTFVVAAGGGEDTITDFAAGGTDDKIDISATTFDFVTFDDLIAASEQKGANVEIKLGGLDELLLLNVDLGSLTAADFIL